MTYFESNIPTEANTEYYIENKTALKTVIVIRDRL